MAKVLNEVLKNSGILEQIKISPGTFRFRDAPRLIVSAVHKPPHVSVLERSSVSTSDTGGNTNSMERCVGRVCAQGPLGNMLEMLASSFNFTYEMITPGDQSWGQILPNGTWSGMVGQVYRKEADLALGPFAQSVSRSNAVDFTGSFFFDGRVIVARKGRPVIDPWGFVMPLSPMVWACLFGTLVVGWVAALFLNHRYKRGILTKTNFAGNVFFQHLRILFSQGINRRFAEKSHQRLLVGSWLLVVLMVVWSYNGTLVSQLAVRHIPQPIQTIRDLLDGGETVVLAQNTIFTSMLAQAGVGELAELADLGKVGRIVYKDATRFPEHLQNYVGQGDHVIIDINLDISFMVADIFTKTRKCDFYKSRQMFFPTLHCMIGQKGNPLMPLISQRVTRVVESGLYDYWLKGMIPFADSCKKSPSKITVMEPLAVSNLWGIFALIGAGFLPAAAVFLCELCLPKD